MKRRASSGRTKPTSVASLCMGTLSSETRLGVRTVSESAPQCADCGPWLEAFVFGSHHVSLAARPFFTANCPGELPSWLYEGASFTLSRLQCHMLPSQVQKSPRL